MKYIVVVLFASGKESEYQVTANSEKEAYQSVWQELLKDDTANNVESLEVVDIL